MSVSVCVCRASAVSPAERDASTGGQFDILAYFNHENTKKGRNTPKLYTVAAHLFSALPIIRSIGGQLGSLHPYQHR